MWSSLVSLDGGQSAKRWEGLRLQRLFGTPGNINYAILDSKLTVSCVFLFLQNQRKLPWLALSSMHIKL